MKSIVTVIGARPQFIKAWPVSQALDHRGIKEVVVHTGQHYDENMSEIFFDELKMSKPSFRLNVGGGSHGAMTGAMLAEIEQILVDSKPDGVMVYGDTNSTLAGALASAKMLIPVVHVEAGLRSFNKAMPEEQNRIVTDHLSDVLLCPTGLAVENLKNENILSGVHHVGDVMYDAALRIGKYAHLKSSQTASLLKQFPSYSLLTIHRAENTETANQILNHLQWVSDHCQSKKVIYPVHPRVKQKLGDWSKVPSKIICIDPVGFIDMASLLDQSEHVFTDSGGVQKEAYFHRVRCTTLREQTEWVETIEAGWNRLYGTEYQCDPVSISDYGDGNASTLVAEKVAALI